ncbi:5'-nucleotidase domain-containing protein 3 [Nymphon striatum]|nr:5'-nucleotidase domain-containing protein 3 [Nymphon striatum]
MKHTKFPNSLQTRPVLSRKFQPFLGPSTQCEEHTASSLWGIYDEAKRSSSAEALQKDINPDAVFANNELNLSEIEVYGFDYDYTLIQYKESVLELIYDLAKNHLVQKFKYPKSIASLEYLSTFAVRGLHYDFKTVEGLTPVKKREVLELYGSDTLPQSVLFGNEGSEYGGDVQLKRTLMGPVEYKKVYVDNNLNNVLVLEIGLFQFDQVSTMVQLSDLFSVPEILLLSQVTEVRFQPPSQQSWLYLQLRKSSYPMTVDVATYGKRFTNHRPPTFQNIQFQKNYLEKNVAMVTFLECLRNAGKKLFIVTNSPFSFVNSGMCYLLGPSWQKFFDVVVVQARKPHFFQEHNRPFRIYDPLLKRHKWERIYQFESSKIYMEGTVNQFHAMTGWENSRVLYFGDHVYADLIDATLDKGWKTGAIISELQDEINILNSNECKHALKWLQTLQLLIEDVQDKKIGNDFIRKLMAEREEVRLTTKHLFNRQFGSMFRTFHNPTFFSRRLFRFSDIYTSKLTNLLNYNVNHTFYPRRGALPHEYVTTVF